MYVDGKATTEERLAIQRHLANCEECREVVSAVARDIPVVVIPFWKRPPVVIGFAMAASLLAVIQLRPDLNPLRGPSPYEELVSAVGTERTIEARLSGGFEYGALRRSGNRGEANLSVSAAAARMQAAAEQHRTPANLHGMGVAQLVLGDNDAAIRTLVQASAEDPSNAQAASDLSAAYLARGGLAVASEDAARALEAAENAIRIDPSLPEAYFNRALALTVLRPGGEAIAAWDEYLARDSTSGWRREAELRRNDLLQSPSR